MAQDFLTCGRKHKVVATDPMTPRVVVVGAPTHSGAAAEQVVVVGELVDARAEQRSVAGELADAGATDGEALAVAGEAGAELGSDVGEAGAEPCDGEALIAAGEAGAELGSDVGEALAVADEVAAEHSDGEALIAADEAGAEHSDGAAPRRSYPWDNNCVLQLPSCKLVVHEWLCNCLAHRATWHRVVETTAALGCAYSTLRLLACWVEATPSRQKMLMCSLLVTAFVMLNSVEYSVVAHTSARIRCQAIVLFTTSYAVLFATTGALFFLYVTPGASRCAEPEALFGVSTILMATLVRFGVPLLMHGCELTGSTRSPRQTQMSTTRLVTLSILGTALLVLGLNLHLYATWLQTFAAVAVIPYLLAVPLLWAIRSGTQPGNPECVWNMWNCFVYVYASAISLGMPTCFYQSGDLTSQVRTLSTVAVLCSGLGLTLFSWCCVPAFSGGYTRQSTLDYMYNY